ncbi:MAG: hypothetical protein IPM64_05770 [Phycisphaerales bacterium]|nr:hypothetical protein [Phycisphaerales bacterium]
MTAVARLLSSPVLARLTEILTRPAILAGLLIAAWISVLVPLLLSDSGLFFAILAGIGVGLLAVAAAILAPALRGDSPEQLFRLSPPRLLAALALLGQFLLLAGYFWRSAEFHSAAGPMDELRRVWHAVAGHVSARRSYPESMEAMGAFRPGSGLELVLQPGRADHPGRPGIIVAFEQRPLHPTEIRLFGAKRGRLVLFHDGRVQRLDEGGFAAAREADRRIRSEDGWPPPR